MLSTKRVRLHKRFNETLKMRHPTKERARLSVGGNLLLREEFHNALISDNGYASGSRLSDRDSPLVLLIKHRIMAKLLKKKEIKVASNG